MWIYCICLLNNDKIMYLKFSTSPQEMESGVLWWTVCGLPASIFQEPSSKFHEIFSVCCLWTWLGPPVTALIYYILLVLWMKSCSFSMAQAMAVGCKLVTHQKADFWVLTLMYTWTFYERQHQTGDVCNSLSVYVKLFGKLCIICSW